jgi:hypothetical protein
MKESDVRDRLDRWGYWPAFGLCLVLTCALPLRYHYLPFLDWPQHCSMAAISSHLGDPAWGFQKYYSLSGWFRPYHMFRWAQVVLGKILGDSIGFRAALLIYLVGMPLCAQVLVNRFGRDRWMGLAAFTILVESNLLWGFAPFVTGVTLLLLGLVLAIDALRDGGWWRYAALAVLGVALFFTHPQVTALWAASTGFIALSAWLLKRCSFRRSAAVVIAILPGFLTLCVFMLSWVDESAKGGASQPPGWQSPLTSLALLPYTTGLALSGQGPLVFYLLALGTLALTTLAQQRVRVAPEAEPGAPNWSFAIFVLLSLWSVLILALPGWWRNEPISVRIPSLAALALLWVPRLRPPTTRREALFIGPGRIVVLLAALGSLGWAHMRFQQFAESMKPVDGVISLLPRDARIATLVYSPAPEGIVALPTYIHIGGYLLIARGGMAGFAFEGVTPYRPEVPRPMLLVDQIWGPSYGWSLPPVFATYYDYVFVRKGRLYSGNPFLPAPGGKPLAKRIFAEGAYELWQVNR